MKLLSRPTLFEPMDCSLQASPSMGFSRQEYWSRVPLPSPGDLPDPGIEPRSQGLNPGLLHFRKMLYPLSHFSVNVKESWVPENWCFWTVVLEITLESPLDCKEIQPVHPKGNQPWIFIGRTDAEAETPILWPPNGKNWLIGKDPDAGKDWRWEEKETTEDKLVGWHHRLNGHKFEQTPGVGDGQGGLACCSLWGCKELDTTEWLNWTELKWTESLWSSGMTIVGSHMAPLFPIIRHWWMTIILKHPWWVTEQLQIIHHLHQQQRHCFWGWTWMLAAPNRTPHNWCLVSNLSALSWIVSVHFCCVCVCVCSINKSCLTLWDPMDPIAWQVPLSMGISRQECWSGFPFLSPGDLPNPGKGPFFLVWPESAYSKPVSHLGTPCNTAFCQILTTTGNPTADEHCLKTELSCFPMPVRKAQVLFEVL